MDLAPKQSYDIEGLLHFVRNYIYMNINTI